MDVVVTCEFRFFQTPDGKVWTPSSFNADFWQRYLNVFNNVKVVARVASVAHAESSWQRSDCERVNFYPLPYYVGFSGLLKNFRAIVEVVNRAVNENDALIYRVPSQTAMLAATFGSVLTKRFALEVVGDPADVFGSGIVNGPMDKLLGWLSASGLRRMCLKALAVSYVTNHYLQERYPARTGATSIACSSIELNPQWLAIQPRAYTSPATQLLFIGSFGQLYKGQDTLIKALSQLRQSGIILHLTMLGGGKYVEAMQLLAKEQEVEDIITFAGEVNAEQVKQALDVADVFVMPSRTEGLPRALIEAMATGLPAIGSKVGGIPELLPDDALFEAEDDNALAQRLARLTQSPERLNAASIQNIAVASEYEKSTLEARRTGFYQSVKSAFEAVE